MSKLKCYNVVCRDNNGAEYSVGVMTSDMERAKMQAVKTLLEGKHLVATAVSAEETDRI